MEKANINDVEVIAEYLRSMYLELDKNDTINDILLFKGLAFDHIVKDIVIFDNRGLFILKDETPVVKKTKIWNGVAVYIKPEYRHTRALKEYYDYMFNLVDGTIMGYTEVNSSHNKVLLKRHELLGYVYKMKRS